uniref:RING-CH-type domain-containing protein n=1 Tax=Kalanchoe fedtschenkoi TaxID=63787 RepID=A0A7N0R8P7_KALFE
MMMAVVSDGSDSIPKVDAAPAPAETQPTTHWKKPNLSLQMPSNASDSPPPQPDFLPINIPAAAPTPRRLSSLFTPSPSSIPKSPFKTLPNRGFGSDVESGGEAATVSSGPRENKPSISRSLSLIFSPRIKTVKGAAVISRSLSVPASDKDQNLQRADSFFRVVPSTAQSIASGSAGNDEAGGEDLPEEEAICRICFVELCVAGRQTLKLECSCRGELALAHQDCAVKWFSVKGNQTCDVCNQQVQNLPVHLLRIPSDAATPAVTPRPSHHQESGGYSGWNDVPILTLVSMLAYFCFLEELLVIAGKMSTSAISVSLPFSCLLGLLSSMASCMLVRRRFIWLYAATQFAFVALFAHIFYSVVRMQAILAILLATFAGLGVTATGNYVLIELLGWRRRSRRIRPSAQASSHAMPQQIQARESANASVEGESNCPNMSATGEPVALV